MGTDWIEISGHEEELERLGSTRILLYTPGYPDDHSVTYRTSQADLAKYCGDATHWAVLTPPNIN